MNSVEQKIQYIVENKKAAKINDVVVDIFTATMINKVASKLNEQNRKKLFDMPINEMVAVSYKIMSYEND